MNMTRSSSSIRVKQTNREIESGKEKGKHKEMDCKVNPKTKPSRENRTFRLRSWIVHGSAKSNFKQPETV